MSKTHLNFYCWMGKDSWTLIQRTIVPILKLGGVGVCPTDTLYGVVGSALNKKTVERIYKLRKRDLKKPMIILISVLSDLKNFGIVLNAKQKKVLDKIWPAKVSVVISCKSKKFSPPQPKQLAGGILYKNKKTEDSAVVFKNDFIRCGGKYLHRGKNTLAFRFPADIELVGLLKKVGPLVAPSANLAGEKSAETYLEAKKYFGEKVDFYVDFGKLKSKPSTLVEMDKDGKLKILRQGAVKIRLK